MYFFYFVYVWCVVIENIFVVRRFDWKDLFGYFNGEVLILVSIDRSVFLEIGF